MEDRDTQSLIRMVESNWHCDFGKEGRNLWREMLEPFDADIATAAVATLAKHPLPGGRARPNIADLRTIIISATRRKAHEIAAESWRELSPAPTPSPSWVKRWKRARAEGDMRVFVEQIPGYVELQAIEPLNAIAYALPTSPTTDATDWIQPGEYE